MAPLHLERPKFGQFARQMFGVTTSQLERCLQIQEEEGGRIGEIMVRRGILTLEQCEAVIDRMATWVAAVRSGDMPDFGFPRPFSLSVCMPCYNEADVVEDCLNASLKIMPHFVENFEIVIVDDGSKDQTAAIVEKVAEGDSRVKLIKHEQNRGYGAAVTTAMKNATCDYVMFTDGDGQFSLLDLPQLLQHLSDHDFVVGYRHQRVEGGARVLNAKAWGMLVRMLLGVKIRDLDCAFKVFPRDIIEQLEMTSEGACINAQMMAQLRKGLKYCEVPVMHYPRYHGAATGANLKVILRAFRELPTLMKYRKMPSIGRRPQSKAPATPSVAAPTNAGG